MEKRGVIDPAWTPELNVELARLRREPDAATKADVLRHGWREQPLPPPQGPLAAIKAAGWGQAQQSREARERAMDELADSLEARLAAAAARRRSP